VWPVVLEVTGLSAGYGQLRVLHEVALRVDRGRILAVTGSNGAGKSTLLRAVSGLLRPTRGEIMLHGKNVAGWPAESVTRAGLAHVPENRLVFPTMSVEDNLALGAWTRRRSSRLVAERRAFVLDVFPRLGQRLGQAAGTMSGGEQQMLAIARGLMSGPSVVLLDEPSIGLAPRVVGEIFQVLGRLRSQEDLAIVLVEQNVHAAFRIADDAIVLDRGRVVLHGPASELADDPRVGAAYLGRAHGSGPAGP
jgi:branched-chain amino acid transport system ATP-binding protein